MLWKFPSQVNDPNGSANCRQEEVPRPQWNNVRASQLHVAVIPFWDRITVEGKHFAQATDDVEKNEELIANNCTHGQVDIQERPDVEKLEVADDLVQMVN